MNDQQPDPEPFPGDPDHAPDTPDDHQMHDLLVGPLSDELAEITALTYAFASGDTASVMRLVMVMMRDNGLSHGSDPSVVWKLAQACQLLAMVVRDNGATPGQFERWVRVAAERS